MEGRSCRVAGSAGWGTRHLRDTEVDQLAFTLGTSLGTLSSRNVVDAAIR